MEIRITPLIRRIKIPSFSKQRKEQFEQTWRARMEAGHKETIGAEGNANGFADWNLVLKDPSVLVEESKQKSNNLPSSNCNRHTDKGKFPQSW